MVPIPSEKSPPQKEKLTTTQYCLTCHNSSSAFPSTENMLSLAISEEALRHSVHKGHGCTDCHIHFSKQDHPNRQFTSIREVSIAGAEACRRCHRDKAAQHRGASTSTCSPRVIAMPPYVPIAMAAMPWAPRPWRRPCKGCRARKCHSEIFAAYQGQCARQGKDKGRRGRSDLLICHFAHDVKGRRGVPIAEGCLPWMPLKGPGSAQGMAPQRRSAF